MSLDPRTSPTAPAPTTLPPVQPAPAPVPVPAAPAAPQGGFYTTASGMSRSPLGFLGLCLVLVYSVAGIAFAVNQKLPPDLAEILVWFIVCYPLLVLLTFVVLITMFRTALIWPSDFSNSADFIKFEELRKVANAALAQSQTNADAVKAVVAAAAVAPGRSTPVSLRPAPDAPALVGAGAGDDPQRGRWGGQRERNGYRLSAGPVAAVPGTLAYFRIPLEVSRTDGQPVAVPVTFHLHPTFTPSVRDVAPTSGPAKLELVGYGAFTVGAELPDGTKLELDLAANDIDAPARFKLS